MRNARFSREYRTRFLGLIANRNNDIEPEIFKLAPGFAAGRVRFYFVLISQNFDGERIDFARWITAGAVRFKAVWANFPNQIFSKNAPSGVAGAEK
jgi:hypothetical protein